MLFEAHDQSSPARRRREVAGLLLVALVTAVPFLNQAFHVDDEVYLRLARELVRSPTGFMMGSAPLFGVQTLLLDHTQHPPLTLGALALLTLAFGMPLEVPFHAAYAGFTLLAVVGLYRLLSRLTAKPWQICLLFVVSPPFMVSSHTLMTDIPFLAFFVLALDAFLELLGRGDNRVSIRAALFASLCSLTQLRGLLLPVLVVGYAWSRRRLSLRLMMAAAAPFAVIGCYELAGNLLWGASPLLHSAGFLQMAPRRLLLTTVTYLASLGGAFFFLALLTLDRTPWRRLAAALGMGMVAVLTHRRETDSLNLLLGILYVAAGVLLIHDLFRGGIGAATALFRRGRPDPSLTSVSSLLGLAVFASLVAMGLFACVRNLLVFLPFVLVALGEKRPEVFRGRRFALAVGLTFILALACSISDYTWAACYRTYAARHTGQAGVHFCGEWGFRYYMEKAGAKYLLASEAGLPARSQVIRPEVAAPENDLAPGLKQRLDLLDVEEQVSRIPLVLMARPDRNCGWYSEGYGILPFCVGTMRQERFSHYVVKP